MLWVDSQAPSALQSRAKTDSLAHLITSRCSPSGGCSTTETSQSSARQCFSTTWSFGVPGGALVWVPRAASGRSEGSGDRCPPAARCSASLSRAAGGSAAHSGDPRAPSLGSGRSELGPSGTAPPGSGSALPGPGPAAGARRSPLPAAPARPRRHFPSGGRAAVARRGRGVAPGSPAGARPGPPQLMGARAAPEGWEAWRPLRGTSQPETSPSCSTLLPAPSPRAFPELWFTALGKMLPQGRVTHRADSQQLPPCPSVPGDGSACAFTD